jgi:hypothetical protein
MPDGFKPIWEMEIKTGLGAGINNAKDVNRIEKLFLCSQYL